MKGVLAFLLEISRLKTIKRTGWVWLGIRDPETIAEHSFRTAMLAWVLGSKTTLNVGRMIEMSLLHDVCEVYAGDLTPYYGILPKGARARKAFLQRWVRLPQKEKVVLAKKKFVLESKALFKLLKHLPKKLQQEVYGLWIVYEKGLSQEGRFVKQIDKIEALLQAIQYFGTGPDTPVVGWWEEVEELVDHPVLREFLKSIEAYLYRKNRKAPMRKEIDFLIHVGALKRNPKAGWAIRKVPDPDSFANHTFLFALMGWIIAKEEKLSLNLGKILKMVLCYNICSIFLQEKTPYDTLLANAKSEKDRKAILEKWVRFPLKTKQRMFVRRYASEKKSFQKIASFLDAKTKAEMQGLWQDVREKNSKEAHFVNNIYVMELLLQALLYWRKDRKFPIKPWWEWAFESSDSQVAFNLMEEFSREFIPSSSTRKK